MRPLASVVILGAALLGARPALSGPSFTDHLVLGSSAQQDSMLVAGAEGATYELRGGAIVELSPGTRFTFEPSIKLKLRKPGDPDTVARSLRLASGRAEVTIPERVKDQTAVLLRGPSKLGAVAKEGVSAFAVDEDRTTAGARTGEMLVGIGNDWKALKEGFARTLSAADPTAIARPILGAPAPVADHPLVLTEGSAPGKIRATWPAVKDAVSYEVQLRSGTGKERVLERAASSNAAAAFAELPPGAYAVRVVAVDRQGLPGAPSADLPVRVVGLETPRGASVAPDGTIELGRDQRVSIVGDVALEASYGTSPDFLAAPKSFGLAHNGPTLVRLRAAGAREEIAIHLEPKGLRANVAIGPKIARWPVDRVVVNVELYDRNGHPVPDDAEVDPSVTVNLEPVSVKWVRKGRTLRAELPPGMAPGPWVVRAEVKDERGELLGRDFLEVAPTVRHEETTTAALSP